MLLLLLLLRLMILVLRRAFPHHSRRLKKQQAGDAPLSEVATSESQTVGEAVQPQPQPLQTQQAQQTKQARQAQQKTPTAQMAKRQRTDLLVQQCCRQMAH